MPGGDASVGANHALQAALEAFRLEIAGMQVEMARGKEKDGDLLRRLGDQERRIVQLRAAPRGDGPEEPAGVRRRDVPGQLDSSRLVVIRGNP